MFKINPLICFSKDKVRNRKQINDYRKLTDACQTKANKINKTGITGKTSTIGEKGAYASGSFATISALDINENKCVIRVLLIIFYFIVGYRLKRFLYCFL